MCPPRSRAGLGSAELRYCVQPRPAVAPRRQRLRAPRSASLRIPPGAADAPWGTECCRTVGGFVLHHKNVLGNPRLATLTYLLERSLFSHGETL